MLLRFSNELKTPICGSLPAPLSSLGQRMRAINHYLSEWQPAFDWRFDPSSFDDFLSGSVARGPKAGRKAEWVGEGRGGEGGKRDEHTSQEA